MPFKLFKVEVQTDATGNWYTNGLTFPTEAEAETYGHDLSSRWMLVQRFRVVEATV